MSRFPVAFRPPAFASRSSDTRRGIRPSSRSASQPNGWTSTGLPRSAHMSCDRGGCPSIPRGRRCSPRTGDRAQPAPAASQRPVPKTTTPTLPSAAAPLDEASTRVQAIHPPGLPLARHHPDGTSSGFGFPPSFAPRRPGAERRTSRWGQAIEHEPGQRSRHQPNLQSCVLTHGVRPRVAPIEATLCSPRLVLSPRVGASADCRWRVTRL
jgi:hypothetical protein